MCGNMFDVCGADWFESFVPIEIRPGKHFMHRKRISVYAIYTVLWEETR